jgi:hypothetical protein
VRSRRHWMRVLLGLALAAFVVPVAIVAFSSVESVPIVFYNDTADLVIVPHCGCYLAEIDSGQRDTVLVFHSTRLCSTIDVFGSRQ